MFRNFTLGKRIASGIALMLVLVVVVGLAGYIGLNRVLRVMSFSNQIAELDQTVSTIERYKDEYLVATFSGDQKGRQAASEHIAQRLKLAAEAINKLGSHAAVGADDAAKLNLANQQLSDYAVTFGEYRQFDEQRDQLSVTVNNSFNEMLEKMDKTLFRADTMVLPTRIVMTSTIIYFNRANEENWTKVQGDLSKLGTSIKDWAEFVKNSAELSTMANAINKQFQDLTASLEQYHTKTVKQLDMRNKMNQLTEKLTAVCKELIDISSVSMQGQVRLSTNLIFGFMAAALVVGIIYAILSIRGIVGRLKTVITGVTDGSEQVAAAADQLSSAGQSLAEGSSEQAASLEESSSSLEEMSSLTSQNAGRAKEAKLLMAEVQQIVEKVSHHMNDMAEAVAEITRSSEETSKIIRTIDEIAFQTNLLALNAAVEAARAGEAGAGFAVVADEVRNLARRAAEASRNTAQLIEDTVKTIRTGSELTMSTKGAFQENMAITVKVGQLVDEISEASNEQAQGIDQVSRAVAEMNTLTQNNAANAEESAGLAEQMSAQAEQMQQYIEQLTALVSKNGERKGKPSESADRRQEPVASAPPEIRKLERKAGYRKALPKASSTDSESMEQHPPGDFKDF